MSISSEIARISGNVSDSLLAVAAKGVTVPSGSNSDDLPELIALISGGGTGAITIEDTADSAGGTVRTITAVDISDTTATASDVINNKWFYTSNGTKTQGTGSGGITPTGNINITQSGQTDVTNYATATVAAGTATAPSTITGTSATVSTGTNTLTLSKTVSVTPSVTTAGYISSGTAGNANVSLTASVTTQAATTFHPSTSDQTISSGKYTTGAQTIKAVTMSNLTAANIKKDVVVQIGDSTDSDCVTSITGTYEGSGGTAAKTKTGTFTGNGTRQVSISCDFEPDLVFWNSDPGTSASSGTVGGVIVRDMIEANRYRNNTTTNSASIQVPITDMNTNGSSYNFRATYENGNVTLYCFSSGSRSLFTNSRTYSYTFIKWTS